MIPAVMRNDPCLAAPWSRNLSQLQPDASFSSVKRLVLTCGAPWKTGPSPRECVQLQPLKAGCEVCNVGCSVLRWGGSLWDPRNPLESKRGRDDALLCSEIVGHTFFNAKRPRKSLVALMTHGGPGSSSAPTLRADPACVMCLVPRSRDSAVAISSLKPVSSSAGLLHFGCRMVRMNGWPWPRGATVHKLTVPTEGKVTQSSGHRGRPGRGREASCGIG